MVNNFVAKCCYLVFYGVVAGSAEGMILNIIGILSVFSVCCGKFMSVDCAIFTRQGSLVQSQ